MATSMLLLLAVRMWLHGTKDQHRAHLLFTTIFTTSIVLEGTAVSLYHRHNPLVSGLSVGGIYR